MYLLNRFATLLVLWSLIGACQGCVLPQGKDRAVDNLFACQGCELPLGQDRALDNLFACQNYLPSPDHQLDLNAHGWDADLATGIVDETPRELSKVVLPSYTIEPPDILYLEAVQVVPKEPYHLQMGDVVSIIVPEAFADAPIDGAYPIGPGGLVELGIRYGSVRIAGQTTAEARTTIIDHLKANIKAEFLATVSVGVLQTVGKQQVEGQHLVGPDGTVTLGTYGSVLVVGMTIAQTKNAIETHLSQFLEAPEVSVDVFSYNSKVFYVITQGAGLGDTVTRLPIMGNETVLDALAEVSGLPEVSSKRIWIARPGRNATGDYQILQVDWKRLTELADVRTNYQIMPGDRIVIGEDKWIAFDSSMSKFLMPFERIMGFSILGANTATRFSGAVLSGGGDSRFGGRGN